MPSQRNIQQLAILKEKLEKAASGVFIDHSGLKVNEQQELREKLKVVEGDFLVAKNTLLDLAFHQSPITSHRSLLHGPTSLVLSYRDEVLPIKVLAEFSKTHEKPMIKGGFLGDKPLTGEEVLRISQLPSKEELLNQLVRQMQAPMVGLVNVLQGNLRTLVTVLKARQDKLN